MSDTVNPSGPYIDEVNRVGRILMAAWEKAEGKPVNASYVATFADMARAVVEDSEETIDGYKDALRLSAEVSNRLIDSLTKKMNELADLEGAISWDTTCLNCASLLDSSYNDHVRAERAEAELARLKTLLSGRRNERE